jgi:hypothetical protein
MFCFKIFFLWCVSPFFMFFSHFLSCHSIYASHNQWLKLISIEYETNTDRCNVYHNSLKKAIEFKFNSSSRVRICIV